MATIAQPKSPAHGTNIFGFHRKCYCKKCDARRKAIHQLVDSFSQLPSLWIEEVLEYRCEGSPLPMWRTLFIPKASADIRNIKKMMQSIQSNDNDSKCFRNYGWQEVADTGIFALWFDDELLLGIHGAGYDFYPQHWEKLYDALGYRWHEQS